MLLNVKKVILPPPALPPPSHQHHHHHDHHDHDHDHHHHHRHRHHRRRRHYNRLLFDATPRASNILPSSITASETLGAFKRRLKMHIFATSFH